jgi:hypothetical protein
MKRVRWMAALSLFLAPLAAVPASGSAVDVVDVKFGDAIDVPRVADGLAKVTVRFQGRSGQGLLITDNHGELSASCEHPTLTTAGTTVPRGEAGTWLFPRTGAYVLDFEHSCMSTSSGGASNLADYTIEIRRVVFHRGAVGERLDTRMTRTTWHAFRVPVPKGPGVRIVSSRPGGSMVEAARKLERPGSEQRKWSTMCTPLSAPTADQGLGSDCGYPFRRRDDYVVFSAAPTTLEPYAAEFTDLDGAPSVWRGERPRLIRFDGKRGDVVRLDVGNLDLDSHTYLDPELTLGGRDGYVYPLANSRDVSGVESVDSFRELVWELPYTGSFAFDVGGTVVRPAAKVRASVRSVRIVPMRLGVPVELDIGPDAWVFAKLPRAETYGFATITVLSASPGLAPGWRAFAPNLSDDIIGPVATTIGTSDRLSTPLGVVVVPGAGQGAGTLTVRLDQAS